MPSPFGEGQTDTPINRLYLGEVHGLPRAGLEYSSAISGGIIIARGKP
jgi:hypothetical protein